MKKKKHSNSYLLNFAELSLKMEVKAQLEQGRKAQFVAFLSCINPKAS